MKNRSIASSRAGRRAAGVISRLLALVPGACSRRPPVLVPPASGVEAEAGFGSAAVSGEEAEIKGKFAFLFRRPGWGRVETFDAFGGTLYYMIFAGDEAYFVVPRKKIYVADRPEEMIARSLGFSLRPDEIIELLGGRWGAEEPGAAATWALSRDGNGRVVRGERGGLVFTVDEFFPGAGVPRVLRFNRPGTSGRLKILSLEFNPPARPGSFETPFLRRYARKTWAEIEEMAR
ncbi:MAG: hypothetical protein ABFD80_10350 [Acidobacteriota bacterium]